MPKPGDEAKDALGAAKAMPREAIMAKLKQVTESGTVNGKPLTKSDREAVNAYVTRRTIEVEGIAHLLA